MIDGTGVRFVKSSNNESTIQEEQNLEQDHDELFEESEEDEETQTEQLILDQMEHVEEICVSEDIVAESFDQNQIREFVDKHFPGSYSNNFILNHCVEVLKEHGISPENTLYGQSVCPDEINHEKGDITDVFTTYLGAVYHLGGLAGIPFTGKTGFSHFSHHVPDGGNLFVMFAPHVGVASNFQIGQYHRYGQGMNGSACGAAVAAYLACGTIVGDLSDSKDFCLHHHDYQMHYIIQQLHKRMDKIPAAMPENERMAEVAVQIYHIARDYIEHVVHTDFSHGHSKCGKLILLGGIQINMPKPMNDIFLPLMFQIREHGKPTIDLMGALSQLQKPHSIVSPEKVEQKLNIAKVDLNTDFTTLCDYKQSHRQLAKSEQIPVNDTAKNGFKQSVPPADTQKYLRTTQSKSISPMFIFLTNAMTPALRKRYHSIAKSVQPDDFHISKRILSFKRDRGSSFVESEVDEQLKIEQLILEELDHAEVLEETKLEEFDEDKILELVSKHFPGSGTDQTILKLCTVVLEKYGVTPENTLYGQSVCPEEVNNDRREITSLFSTYLGEIFHLGGLAGIPFTGKTGFSAFSHHIPDGGNLFVLFAPHIGISSNYKVGQIRHLGQNHNGSACGAAVGAFFACETEARIHLKNQDFLWDDHHDYQMHYLIQQLDKRKDKIFARETANERMEELAMQVYQIVRDDIEHVVHTNFAHGHGGKLILLGGLQINLPSPMDDQFLPLMFQVREHGKQTVDLLGSLRY